MKKTRVLFTAERSWNIPTQTRLTFGRLVTGISCGRRSHLRSLNAQGSALRSWIKQAKHLDLFYLVCLKTLKLYKSTREKSCLLARSCGAGDLSVELQ